MPRLDAETFESLVSATPAWMAERRREGFDFFEKLSMPTGREEAWKYIDLDFDLSDFSAADPGVASLSESHPILKALADNAGTARVVDGSVRDITGDHFTLLGEAGPHIQEVFGLAVPVDLDLFAAAHRAFGSDGLVVHLPKNEAPIKPLVVDIQSVSPGVVSFPHLTVLAEANSECSIVVVFRSPNGLEALAVPQIEINVGDGARINVITVQDWGDSTRGLTYERMSLGRDATGRIGEAGLGGRLGRLDVDVALRGDGSSSELAGVYFGDRTQQLDYRIVINHHGRSTHSDVFLKGAVGDQAESVFTGLLKIWPDATKTSTFETNRNLVLSDGAKAHSVPNLEILCDDVVCGHGSTVGPLEEEHLYYLMSRGLPKDRAERVLIRGFFEEMIKRFSVPAIAVPLRASVQDKFTKAQRDGRL